MLDQKSLRRARRRAGESLRRFLAETKTTSSLSLLSLPNFPTVTLRSRDCSRFKFSCFVTGVALLRSYQGIRVRSKMAFAPNLLAGERVPWLVPDYVPTNKSECIRKYICFELTSSRTKLLACSKSCSSELGSPASVWLRLRGMIESDFRTASRIVNYQLLDLN